MLDCAIVGGGPAGLSAALVLGRSRRNIVLFDNNNPRNRVTKESHGYLTRDGIKPSEFKRIAVEEILKYPSIQLRETEIINIQKLSDGFELETESGERVQARKVILATGLKEVFPEIQGLHDFYGKSLFNCPFCDGWELRDKPLIAVSEHPGIFQKAKLLYNWSRDLVVCTNGHNYLETEQKDVLQSKGIRVIETPIAAFEGQNGNLERVVFTDGSKIERSGGFIVPIWLPKATFSEQLGYKLNKAGGIATDEMGRSSVKGLYAAGDASYVGPSQLIYAAASGSKTAMAVVADLVDEDWRLF